MGLWETLGGLGATIGGGLLTATGVGAVPGLALAGAGAGLLKSGLVDQPNEDQDKHVAAETIRYAPLTGQATPGIRRANPIGAALQGGMTGAALGQGLAAASAATPAAAAGATPGAPIMNSAPSMLGSTPTGNIGDILSAVKEVPGNSGASLSGAGLALGMEESPWQKLLRGRNQNFTG